MHREDGHADIHRAHGHERRGDGAERRAATAVAAVHEVLHGDVLQPRELPHDGDCLRVARIRLGRRLLDDDTPAEHRMYGGIALFHMRRVQAMRHVHGEQESLRERPRVRRLAARLRVDAPQRPSEHRGARSLLRTAADLLVIEERDEAHARRHAAGRRAEEPLEARPDRREIVEARRGQKLIREPQRAARLEGIRRKLIGKDFLLRHAEQRRKCRLPPVPFAHIAEERRERQHIRLRVEPALLVDLAVHVDGEARNRHERPAEVHELRHGMERVRAAQHDTPRESERTVEPRAQDEAAVRLDIEHAVASAREPRRGFQPEAWEIRMRRRHAQRPCVPHREREQRRPVHRDEIPSARRELPVLRERELRKASAAQSRRRGRHRMRRRRRLLNERKKRLNLMCHIASSSCKGTTE